MADAEFIGFGVDDAGEFGHVGIGDMVIKRAGL